MTNQDNDLEEPPPDILPSGFDYLTKHGIDKDRTPPIRTRRPPPSTPLPPAAPGTPHIIRATPEEIQQLIHALAQLYTTNPDTTP